MFGMKIIDISIDYDGELSMLTNVLNSSHLLEKEIDAVMFLYFVEFHDFSLHVEFNRVKLCP